MDVFLWLFGIAVAVGVISNVYLLLAFIKPMLETNAREIIRAKKNKMPLIILDDGKKYTFHVAKKFFDDAVEDENEGFISIYPNSLKWAKGILMGIGEGHRGITVDPETMAQINLLSNAGYRISDIMKALETEKGVKDVSAQEKQAVSNPPAVAPGDRPGPGQPATANREFEIDWSNG